MESSKENKEHGAKKRLSRRSSILKIDRQSLIDANVNKNISKRVSFSEVFQVKEYAQYYSPPQWLPEPGAEENYSDVFNLSAENSYRHETSRTPSVKGLDQLIVGARSPSQGFDQTNLLIVCMDETNVANTSIVQNTSLPFGNLEDKMDSQTFLSGLGQQMQKNEHKPFFTFLDDDDNELSQLFPDIVPPKNPSIADLRTDTNDQNREESFVDNMDETLPASPSDAVMKRDRQFDSMRIDPSACGDNYLQTAVKDISMIRGDAREPGSCKYDATALLSRLSMGRFEQTKDDDEDVMEVNRAHQSQSRKKPSATITSPTETTVDDCSVHFNASMDMEYTACMTNGMENVNKENIPHVQLVNRVDVQRLSSASVTDKAQDSSGDGAMRLSTDAPPPAVFENEATKVFTKEDTSSEMNFTKCLPAVYIENIRETIVSPRAEDFLCRDKTSVVGTSTGMNVIECLAPSNLCDEKISKTFEPPNREESFCQGKSALDTSEMNFTECLVPVNFNVEKINETNRPPRREESSRDNTVLDVSAQMNFTECLTSPNMTKGSTALHQTRLSSARENVLTLNSSADMNFTECLNPSNFGDEIDKENVVPFILASTTEEKTARNHTNMDRTNIQVDMTRTKVEKERHRNNMEEEVITGTILQEDISRTMGEEANMINNDTNRLQLQESLVLTNKDNTSKSVCVTMEKSLSFNQISNLHTAMVESNSEAEGNTEAEGHTEVKGHTEGHTEVKVYIEGEGHNDAIGHPAGEGHSGAKGHTTEANGHTETEGHIEAEKGLRLKRLSSLIQSTTSKKLRQQSCQSNRVMTCSNWRHSLVNLRRSMYSASTTIDGGGGDVQPMFVESTPDCVKPTNVLDSNQIEKAPKEILENVAKNRNEKNTIVADCDVNTKILGNVPVEKDTNVSKIIENVSIDKGSNDSGTVSMEVSCKENTGVIAANHEMDTGGNVSIQVVHTGDLNESGRLDHKVGGYVMTDLSARKVNLSASETTSKAASSKVDLDMSAIDLIAATRIMDINSNRKVAMDVAQKIDINISRNAMSEAQKDYKHVNENNATEMVCKTRRSISAGEMLLQALEDDSDLDFSLDSIVARSPDSSILALSRKNEPQLEHLTMESDNVPHSEVGVDFPSSKDRPEILYALGKHINSEVLPNVGSKQARLELLNLAKELDLTAGLLDSTELTKGHETSSNTHRFLSESTTNSLFSSMMNQPVTNLQTFCEMLSLINDLPPHLGVADTCVQTLPAAQSIQETLQREFVMDLETKLKISTYESFQRDVNKLQDEVQEQEAAMEANPLPIFTNTNTRSLKVQAKNCHQACHLTAKTKLKKLKISKSKELLKSLSENYEHVSCDVDKLACDLQKLVDENNSYESMLIDTDKELSRTNVDLSRLKGDNQIYEDNSKMDQYKETYDLILKKKTLQRELQELKVREFELEHTCTERAWVKLACQESEKPSTSQVITQLKQTVQALETVLGWRLEEERSGCYVMRFLQLPIQVTIRYQLTENKTIDSVSMASLLNVNSEDDYQLVCQLVEETVDCRQLLVEFPTINHLCNMMKKLTGLVGAAHDLRRAIFSADILHPLTFKQFSVSIPMLSVKNIREVVLTVTFAPGDYNCLPANASVQVITGSLQTQEVEDELLQVIKGSNPFLRAIEVTQEYLDN